MISRRTLQLNFYIAVGIVVLMLTGIISSFEGRYVIPGRLPLGIVLLVGMIGGAGYFAANHSRAQGITAMIVNGVVASLMVGVSLAILIIIEANIDLRFVFQNLTNPVGTSATFGLELIPGIIALLLVSVVLGILSAGLLTLPDNLRRVIILTAVWVITIGLLENQIRQIIALPDAVVIALVFGAGYVSGMRQNSLVRRVGPGVAVGIVAGILLAVLVSGGAAADNGFLRGAGIPPVVLGMGGDQPIPLFVLVFGMTGLLGAVTTGATRTIHNSLIYLVVALLIVGILNWQGAMNEIAALLVTATLFVTLWFIPAQGEAAEKVFFELTKGDQTRVQSLAVLAAGIIMLVAPIFLGQYITSVIDRVGLYVIMGIGLNIVVGYAGLLDLGYVAFFAIGAYAIGILTTPSPITCGGLDPRTVTPDVIAQACTGVMTFWQAWPLAILVSALAGVMLGIPILRLRGDYLAIVTLGFGEIINRIALSNQFKPLLGAAQGISPIPGPVLDVSNINPAWRFDLVDSRGIYYLILAGILLTSFIALRLSGTRLGRAWRAMRADEDVAQAMGINLVAVKLLAFAIGAAFAGMGGAVAGAWQQGIFPNSYTLQVSINVLALIIIGGLGSIPGVIIGALLLIGLPEVLREFEDYRLLAFGALLVITMLLRPEGLIPPPIRRLTASRNEAGLKKGTAS